MHFNYIIGRLTPRLHWCERQLALHFIKTIKSFLLPSSCPWKRSRAPNCHLQPYQNSLTTISISRISVSIRSNCGQTVFQREVTLCPWIHLQIGLSRNTWGWKEQCFPDLRPHKSKNNLNSSPNSIFIFNSSFQANETKTDSERCDYHRRNLLI